MSWRRQAHVDTAAVCACVCARVTSETREWESTAGIKINAVEYEYWDSLK